MKDTFLYFKKFCTLFVLSALVFSKAFADVTTVEVIKAIGGQEVYDKLPVLNLGNNCGSTDYLDFITPIMMGNNSIMKGTDACDRKFVAIKYRKISENIYFDNDYYVETMFQRSRHDENSWVFGRLVDKINLFSNLGGLIDERALERVAKLVKGEILLPIPGYYYTGKYCLADAEPIREVLEHKIASMQEALNNIEKSSKVNYWDYKAVKESLDNLNKIKNKHEQEL